MQRIKGKDSKYITKENKPKGKRAREEREKNYKTNKQTKNHKKQENKGKLMF